jgi:hypothetical protein
MNYVKRIESKFQIYVDNNHTPFDDHIDTYAHTHDSTIRYVLPRKLYSSILFLLGLRLFFDTISFSSHKNQSYQTPI